MLLTGSFSLIAVKDGQGYEYAFKRTARYAAPMIDAYTGAGVPDGWTSSPSGTSAVHAYEWQVQRTKSADIYGPWSAPSLYSRWSADGAAGEKGDKGAKMRIRVWTAGQQCLQGTGDEQFYDVVLYNDKLYLCVKSHTASSANNPLQSVSGHSGYWEIAQDWVFIATKLLLAEKIKASMIELEGLVTSSGCLRITDDGRIVGRSASFENTVMRYKVNDITFLTTKVYRDTWVNINGIPSDDLYEYDLAVLSADASIDGVWYSARKAFAWRNNKWKALEGLTVYTSTDSNGNVSVSYAVLDLNPEDGNIVVLDAPVKIYVVVPEAGESNYGTQIRLMSMTQAVARNPISSQWTNREYHVGRYGYSSSENIVMTGRAGSTVNIGGHCELVSTPLGWLAKANVGMVDERMIARLKVQYISGSKTYSVSAECLYNYRSANFSATRTAAGKVVVSIPYSLVEDIGASDIKVYGTGITWNPEDNTVFSSAPCRATLQSYYQDTVTTAKALVYISNNDTLNDGDFVMEIYKYSNTYVRQKDSISG